MFISSNVKLLHENWRVHGAPSPGLE